jgi:asparagine synthase (glutamine-hydrolysing)
VCGIAGVVATEPDAALAQVAACMGEALAHRGPDGEGICVTPSGRAAFAHRRLAIIDLASGQQPMFDASGRLGIALNGEIYNYRELRSWAEARGYVFRTQSDTEVILAGFHLEREAIIPRLRGMFAFALWDAASNEVWLVRDRFGKKPLFYSQVGGRVFFASELKAVLRAVAPPIDHVALIEYLTLGYIPGPRTVYRSIKRVPPAHQLHIKANGAIHLERFWALPLPVEAESDRSAADWEDRIHQCLMEAVKLRLVADVPVGAFLSGGLDSSTVVALSLRQGAPRPFHTFSIRVVGASAADADAAQDVSRLLDTVHHEEQLDCPPPEHLVSLLRHFDEPFGDSSLIPTAAVSALARKFVPVALSGDGGDEMFGGYGMYATLERLSRIGHYPFARQGGAFASRLWPRSARGWASLFVLGAPEPERYLRLASQRWGGAVAALITSATGADTQEAGAELGDLFSFPADRSPSSPVARAQWIDASRSYLAGDILPKVDLASMRYGLEVRVPYLDHLLAEELAFLPAELRMRRGRGKLLLRRIAGRYLPPRIIDRPKMGFTVPLAHWLDGRLAPLVEGYVRDVRSPLADYVERKAIQTVFERRPDGERARLIFGLLSVAVWAEQHQAHAAAA